MSPNNVRANGLLSAVIVLVATIWLWNDDQNTLRASQQPGQYFANRADGATVIACQPPSA